MNIYKNTRGLIKATVIKRPSAQIKSPYVADIELGLEDSSLAHCPSLGCSGHVEKGCTIYVSKKDGSGKCSYSADFALYEEPEKNNTQLICVNPKFSEKMVNIILKNKIFSTLKPKEYKAEQTRGNSRFDFIGKDQDDREFILEVKHVPLADYQDCLAKEKKKYKEENKTKKYNEKIAYFPDGYRKKQTDTVSPRALKHIEELTMYKIENPGSRAIMCYVIPRIDVSSFQASNIDPIYKEAFRNAVYYGVEIIPLVLKWNTDYECKFITDKLPINLD